MGGTVSFLPPARLGNTTLGREELAADRKSCKRFGPCGVGEKALYLNSFFIDRRYYVALSSVRRVFKRVAMSKGGFSGKGVFGSIPYLVVEYDGGQVKQCTFKHEDDVDRMIECIARYLPDIPLHSEKVERPPRRTRRPRRPALRQEPDSGRRDDPRAA